MRKTTATATTTEYNNGRFAIQHGWRVQVGGEVSRQLELYHTHCHRSRGSPGYDAAPKRNLLGASVQCVCKNCDAKFGPSGAYFRQKMSDFCRFGACEPFKPLTKTWNRGKLMSEMNSAPPKCPFINCTDSQPKENPWVPHC